MPLHVAAFKGHEKVVEALLAAKADTTITSQVQQSVYK
jgi:ankyrin repeat protein